MSLSLWKNAACDQNEEKDITVYNVNVEDEYCRSQQAQHHNHENSFQRICTGNT